MSEYRPLIIGDLHISDKYSGRHVNYLENCIEVIQLITEKMRENKVTHLILTGDIIGLSEKNLVRRDTLLYFMKVLQKWNDMTNGNVYSIRGNHDFGSKLTDFEVFTSLGLIKSVDNLDIGGIRFHLIDYGEETRQIEVDKDRYNVAIMHNNMQIEGVTTWFRGGKDGVEVSSLNNLYGVELIVAGHIHNPSVRMVMTSIRDKDIHLFYPGCPTRPTYDRDIWEKCFGVLFNTNDEGDVSLGQVVFELKPASEIFANTYADIEDEVIEEDTEPTYSLEELSSILAELQNYNIASGEDYKAQIRRVAGIDKEAAELALNYLEKAENKLK